MLSFLQCDGWGRLLHKQEQTHQKFVVFDNYPRGVGRQRLREGNFRHPSESVPCSLRQRLGARVFDVSSNRVEPRMPAVALLRGQPYLEMSQARCCEARHSKPVYEELGVAAAESPVFEACEGTTSAAFGCNAGIPAEAAVAKSNSERLASAQ